MALRIILAASAALAFAAPALAQDAPAAPAAAAAEAPSPAAIALEAQGEAFKGRMDEMKVEIEAAIAGAGSDQAKGMADVDAILARYQPDIDGFVVAFGTFIDAEAAAATDESERAELTGAKAGVETALSSIPAQVRAAAQAALAAQAAPPTAPAAAE
ncbi:MAG: translation initiation factor IF-2 [Brevundimonas sp.]|uniref:translation initiation factor IF-2 n=1 Tax=Brevundimonas sp. TaxID=1871086 RepID=UPI00391DA062